MAQPSRPPAVRHAAAQLAAAALLAAACGGEPRPFDVRAELHGATAEWATAPELTPRTAEAVETTAAAWGRPVLDLHDLEIVYTDRLIDCGGKAAVGCARGGEDGVWRLEVMVYGAPCLEATTLAHEVGHLVLGGDPQHRDPRWRDRAFWSGVAERLRATSAARDAACAEYLAGEDHLFNIERS